MNVGDSVRKSIDDWEDGEFDAAMLHACNAVDGTARRSGLGRGNRARFCRLLRDNFDILGPMGIPGIDLRLTRFPAPALRPSFADGPDVADIIYEFHRCAHAHGDDLAIGFELVPDAAGRPGHTRLEVTEDAVRLSDRIIFALLALAVAAPANVAERVPDSYYFTFGRAMTVLPINAWWGRRSDLVDLLATEAMPRVKLDFGDWM